MIKEVKLNTLEMFKNKDKTDRDYELQQSIAEYMNGEMAFVIESSFDSGKFLFLGLKDGVKDKELHYMMEQDGIVGAFVNDRNGFDEAWDSGEYDACANFYLEPQYIIFENGRS